MRNQGRGDSPNLQRLRLTTLVCMPTVIWLVSDQFDPPPPHTHTWALFLLPVFLFISVLFIYSFYLLIKFSHQCYEITSIVFILQLIWFLNSQSSSIILLLENQCSDDVLFWFSSCLVLSTWQSRVPTGGENQHLLSIDVFLQDWVRISILSFSSLNIFICKMGIIIPIS